MWAKTELHFKVYFEVPVPTLQQYVDCPGVWVLPGNRNSVCSYTWPGGGLHCWPSWFHVWIPWSMVAPNSLLWIQATIWSYATTRTWVRASTRKHLLHKLHEKHVLNFEVLWVSRFNGKITIMLQEVLLWMDTEDRAPWQTTETKIDCIMNQTDMTSLFHSRRKWYTGYRHLVWPCWGYLGREVRVPLPACAVHKICQLFPSVDYRGFQGLQWN